jgi:hypothetical protein
MAKRDDRSGEDRLLHPRNEGSHESHEREHHREWRRERATVRPRVEAARGTHAGGHEGKQSAAGEPKHHPREHDEGRGPAVTVGPTPLPGDHEFTRRGHGGTKPSATTGEATRRRHPPEE